MSRLSKWWAATMMPDLDVRLAAELDASAITWSRAKDDGFDVYRCDLIALHRGSLGRFLFPDGPSTENLPDVQVHVKGAAGEEEVAVSLRVFPQLRSLSAETVPAVARDAERAVASSRILHEATIYESETGLRVARGYAPGTFKPRHLKYDVMAIAKQTIMLLCIGAESEVIRRWMDNGRDPKEG